MLRRHPTEGVAARLPGARLHALAYDAFALIVVQISRRLVRGSPGGDPALLRLPVRQCR